jgi:monoterpene epsilon-lactone hydrolase
MQPMLRCAILLAAFSSVALFAQQPPSEPIRAPAPQPTTAVEAPNRDTSYIDAQGTAHVTRVVPVPATISTQAQLVLGHAAPDQAPVPSLEERRSGTDQFTAVLRKAWTRLCPNQLVEDKIAGVPVRIVTPDGLPEANRDKVLLNLHGGGFNSDSGSYTESIPIASFAKIKVVAVLYRLRLSTLSRRPWMIRWLSTRSC